MLPEPNAYCSPMGMLLEVDGGCRLAAGWWRRNR
jgi:hypothetical protein